MKNMLAVEAHILWDAVSHLRDAQRRGAKREISTFMDEIAAIRDLADAPEVKARCTEIIDADAKKPAVLMQGVPAVVASVVALAVACLVDRGDNWLLPYGAYLLDFVA